MKKEWFNTIKTPDASKATPTGALSSYQTGYCVQGTTAAFRQEIYTMPGAFYTLAATKLW